MDAKVKYDPSCKTVPECELRYDLFPKLTPWKQLTANVEFQSAMPLAELDSTIRWVQGFARRKHRATKKLRS